MTLLVVVLAVRPYCRCEGPDAADRTERRSRPSRPNARPPAVSFSGHYATSWSTWICAHRDNDLAGAVNLDRVKKPRTHGRHEVPARRDVRRGRSGGIPTIVETRSRVQSLGIVLPDFPWLPASSCRATFPISLRGCSPLPPRVTEGQRSGSILASALARDSSGRSFSVSRSTSSAGHRSSPPGG
jgi:hypothetical protein